MSSTISSSDTLLSNKSLERKVRKPKIEKMRRARINTSLEQLKKILLQNTLWRHTQGTRPTKLEKADILEMTVRYIEMLHEKVASENFTERRHLADLTNLRSERERKSHQSQIINDNKVSASLSSSTTSLWFHSRFNLQQKNFNNVKSSDNLSDKENFFLNKMMRQLNEDIFPSISMSAQQSISSPESSLSSFERGHWRPW